MEEWPGGSYLVINIAPIVPGDKICIAIGYRYIYYKDLGFIAMEGAISTKAGVSYLSRYPSNYSNVYICPVLPHHMIVG